MDVSDVDKCNMVRYLITSQLITDELSTCNTDASRVSGSVLWWGRTSLHLMIKQYCYALHWIFFSNLLMPLYWKIQQYINTIVCWSVNWTLSILMIWYYDTKCERNKAYDVLSWIIYSKVIFFNLFDLYFGVEMTIFLIKSFYFITWSFI